MTFWSRGLRTWVLSETIYFRVRVDSTATVQLFTGQLQNAVATDSSSVSGQPRIVCRHPLLLPRIEIQWTQNSPEDAVACEVVAL